MHAVSLLFHDVYVTSPAESGFRSKAADRYKLSAREFDAQLASLARSLTGAPILATDLLRGTLRAPAAARVHPVAITVDDGGVSYYTVVAEHLEALGWRGHCFVSTDAIGRPGFLSAAQLRELDSRGHVIGSHSASHPPRFSACSTEVMRREWSVSRQVLEGVLGHEVRTASVPGGYYSRAVAHAAREAGLGLLFTSEPTTSLLDVGGILVAGRFTLRPGHASDMACRFARPRSWTRYREWASWNAKGVVKPILGPSYSRVADWISHA